MTTNGTPYHIGVIFTPLDWAIFACKTFDIYNRWIDGATIFDPTMGDGNLLSALVQMGIDEGKHPSDLPLHHLFGNEINDTFYKEALSRFAANYAVDMTSNFSCSDIFDLTPTGYDIIIGNPPWMNFTNLPPAYKERLKPVFLEYGLVENPQAILLGKSRVDIAALVIQKSISDFLKPNGNAYFFHPLSLLLNDGAHDAFRLFNAKGVDFSLEIVYDFEGVHVFQNVATRHGLVHYKKNRKTCFPVPYWQHIEEKWEEKRASPLLSITGPLSVFSKVSPPPLFEFKPITLKKDAKPRQGVNTSGANNVFFFTSYQDIDPETCLMNQEFLLPKRFVFPLLTGDNFNHNSNLPTKWVLLPYSKNGRPLDLKTLHSHPLLWSYLELNMSLLKERKGKLIQTWRDRGYWWALLGVGKYNFARHKVVWEAFGKKSFEPMIFSGDWQVNQSLQAYIPLTNLKEAKRIKKALKNPAIEHYLHSLKMDGTMNWAQPGKISKLFKFRED